MRTVDNFRQAKIDYVVNLPDVDLITVAHYSAKNDAIVLGSSSALNVAGALRAAAASGPGKTIVTFACDAGERSYSKLYNPDFLNEKNLSQPNPDINALFERYKAQALNNVVSV